MQKGEIWLIKLDETKGHEQIGTRPGLIIGKGNRLNVIIPITSNLDRSNLSFTEIIDCSKENGLKEDSVALIFQIRSLDESRFIRKLGKIKQEKYEAIHALLIDMTKL